MKKEIHLLPVQLKQVGATLLATSTILVASGLSNHAAAQTIRTFTVIPPTIHVTVQPGTRIEGTMKVVNDSQQAIPFSVTIQDFIVDNDEGIPSFIPSASLSNKYAASNWVSVQPNSFNAASHQKVELHYYVQVPGNATAGGHYAAATFAALGSTPEGSGARVTTGLGTLFYITVPGNIHEQAIVKNFSVPSFTEYGPANITTQILNKGDLHITPKGTVAVYNMLGQKVGSDNLQTLNIFPGVSRSYTNRIGSQFMIGRYKAQLMATYGQKANLSLMATMYFWVFPWKVAIVVILIVIAGILAIELKKRKKNPPTKPETPAGQDTPPPPAPAPTPEK